MSADTTTPAKVPPQRQAPPPRVSGVPRRRRTANGAGIPWLLLAPCLLVLALVMGYPLVRLVTLSFQSFGQSQLWGFKPAEWVGFDNFS
ncbi:sugar ABC transporter permease, partial [Streptomyces prunicolor]